MELKNPLDQIEYRLRQVIESWITPFGRHDFQRRLAHEVVEAMRETITRADNGKLVAPHLFTIRLHPSLVIELRGSSILQNLPEAIRQAAREADLTFLAPPELRLEPDETFQEGEISVKTHSDFQSPGNTAALLLNLPTEPSAAALNASAFLILAGNQIFPLRETVTNLGRRSDNHLVIEDPRISRAHAQIRHTRDQYILFDLNSTGGTSVNGLRIHHCVLKAGDVISLAGVSLIFGLETPPNIGDSRTTRLNTKPPTEQL
jgi:hypothetical protein